MPARTPARQRLADLVLFQGQDDLLLGVSALPQGALQRGRTHIILGLVFREDVTHHLL